MMKEKKPSPDSERLRWREGKSLFMECENGI
jgi:hypothetical protein